MMRCLELFAGAGGAALGLERAGFHHAALCEWDANACATLRAAGLGPVVEGDVRDLDAIESFLRLSESDAWRIAGDRLLDSELNGDDWTLERERVALEMIDRSTSPDLLWSSWPCQPWSSAGKRLGAEDDRNGWPWTVDAIDRFRPRWLLAENVRGLLNHSEDGHPDSQKCPRCYFENVILVQLRERFGHVGWWLLDAADYGVPQHRRRVIIWAGPAPLRAPRPTHGAPSKARQGDMFGRVVLPWVSMGAALDLGSERKGSGPWIGDRPSPTVSTVEVFGSTDKYRSPGDRPKMNRASDALWADTGRRQLTIAECATLQAFPDDHPWQGNARSRYRQVGNAVPPPLAEVVGLALINAGRGQP